MFWNREKEKLTIFFDVDGVLNKEREWITPFSLNPSCIKYFGELKKQLCKRYECEYVICSTWRAGMAETPSKESPQYRDLANRLASVGIRISDGTPLTDKNRQDEILYYIRRHEIESYIVIDDDPSLYHDPSSINLYVTDHKTGIKKEDIRKIVSLSKHL